MTITSKNLTFSSIAFISFILAQTHQVAEHLTDYPKDLNGQWKQSAIETGGEKGEHAPRPAYTNLFLGYSHLSKVPNERRQAEGGWRPSIGQHHLHCQNRHQLTSAFNIFRLFCHLTVFNINNIFDICILVYHGYMVYGLYLNSKKSFVLYFYFSKTE